MRYQLAQWFNLVEASDRYLDDQSIQLTSEACESLALARSWFCFSKPKGSKHLLNEFDAWFIPILQSSEDQSLNSYFHLARLAVNLGHHELYPTKPKCHVPCLPHTRTAIPLGSKHLLCTSFCWKTVNANVSQVWSAPQLGHDPILNVIWDHSGISGVAVYAHQMGHFDSNIGNVWELTPCVDDLSMWCFFIA